MNRRILIVSFVCCLLIPAFFMVTESAHDLPAAPELKLEPIENVATEAKADAIQVKVEEGSKASKPAVTVRAKLQKVTWVQPKSKLEAEIFGVVSRAQRDKYKREQRRIQAKIKAQKLADRQDQLARREQRLQQKRVSGIFPDEPFVFEE